MQKKLSLILTVMFFILCSFTSGLIQNTDIIAYFPQDDNTKFDDSTGNLSDCTRNSVTHSGAGGIISGAYQSSGSGQDVSCDSNFFGGRPTDATINIWLNPDTITSTRRMVYIYNDISEDVCWFIDQDTDLTANTRIYVDSAGGASITYFDLNASEWDMITVRIRNNSWVEVQVNANSVDNNTITGVQTCPAVPEGHIVFGYTDGAVDDFDGLTDEISLWNRLLTDSEITELYNGGAPTVNQQWPFAGGPVVDLVSPTNNTHTNNDPIELLWNVTGTGLTNCSVYINGSLETTVTDINTSLSNLAGYNLTEVEGRWEWYVNCFDEGGSTNSTSWIFIIDRTNPDITWINPVEANTTIHYRNLVDNFLFNLTFDDTYLFGYNVTAFYPNGSVWWNNLTGNLTGETFNFQRLENVSDKVTGTYTLRAQVEDDHTAKWIPEMPYVIYPNYIKYETPTANISINTLFNVNGEITTEKLIDRYTFKFGTGGTKGKWNFELRSTEPLYYRGNLYPFPVFVTGKQWVDFNIPNIPNVKYTVQYKSDNLYEIEVEIEEEYNIDLKFRSLGGLNTRIETATFQILDNLPPNITAFTPVTKNFTAAQNSSVSFSVTANDPEGDNPLTYEWVFNNTQKINTSASFTWTVPDNVGLGIFNVTAFVNDSNNLRSATSWNVNITNATGAPVVTNVRLDPTPLAFNNETLFGYCTGTDTESQLLKYEYLLYKNEVLLFNSSPDWCYQEFANSSTSCGGLATGNYNLTNGWSNSGNLWDGDYDTLSFLGTGIEEAYFYVNYSKPTNASNESLWQIKDSGGVTNLTINSTCFSQSNLQFRIFGNNNSYVTSQCYNGAIWVTLRNSTIFSNIYEEGMYWNLPYSARDVERFMVNITSTNTSSGDEFILGCRVNDGVEYSDYVNSSVTRIIIGLLNLSFYDIDTGSSIIGPNITVQLIGDDARFNITNTGNIFYDDLDSAGDYTITYVSDTYRQGSYIITGFNNQLISLNLSMTKTNETSLTLITVLDRFSKDQVKNGIVTIQRYKDDAWITDQILKTDFNGQTEAYFILSTVFYNFLVEVDGTVFFGTINSNQNKKNIYAEDVTNGIIVEIDTSPDTTVTKYQTNYDIITSCRFINTSNSTGTFIFTYDDTNNIQHDAFINVFLSGNVNCTANVTDQESASINCPVTIGAAGLSTFTARGYIDDILVEVCDASIGTDPARNFNWGVTGFILGLFIVVIGYIMFASIPNMSITIGTSIFVLCAFINLMFGSTSYTILLLILFTGFLLAKTSSKGGVNA